MGERDDHLLAILAELQKEMANLRHLLDGNRAMGVEGVRDRLAAVEERVKEIEKARREQVIREEEREKINANYRRTVVAVLSLLGGSTLATMAAYIWRLLSGGLGP